MPPIPSDPGVDPADLDAPPARSAAPKDPPSFVMPTPTLSPPPGDDLVFSDSGSFERPVAAPLPPPEPARPQAPAVDPIELAKMLAKAAAARSATPVDGPNEFARRPQAAPPAAPAGRLANVPPPSSKLANIPPPSSSKLANVPPPVAPRQAEAPIKPAVTEPPWSSEPPDYSEPPDDIANIPRAPVKTGSRLSSAPPPPRRTRSAAEVLEEMARQPEPPKAAPEPPPRVQRVESPRPAETAPRLPEAAPRPDLRAAVEVLVKTSLPSLAGAAVVGSQVVEDREVQKALWKGHRARFLATGDVEHGLASSAVIHALGRTPAGALAVARLVVGDRDWLVWVDTSTAACVAAFPNASLWFNGL